MEDSDLEFKIVLAGDANVGKRCILNSYVGNCRVGELLYYLIWIFIYFVLLVYTTSQKGFGHSRELFCFSSGNS